jgi:phosphatidylglycerol---prolipoprotein diacylglyceryl transferase
MGTLGAIGWEVLDRIRFGDFGISPHGIGIAAGYLAGSWWMLREGRKRGLTEDDMSNVLLRALIGAIVGARFFYVVAHFAEFEELIDTLKIWEGGISLIGGIFGAIIAAYPYMRSHRMGFRRTMDSASIGLAFGILFGRVGDLIIGDHLGKPASWALAWVYKGGELSGYQCIEGAGCETQLFGGQYQRILENGTATLFGPDNLPIAQGIGVHQTALYDFISTFFLFAFLVWLARRRRHEGVLIAVFALWYGVVRVATDFLRVDKRFFELTGSQWASVTVAAIAAFALAKWALRGRVEPAPATAEADTDAASTGADVLSRLVGEAQVTEAEGSEPPPVGPPEAGPERMVDEGGPPPEEPPAEGPEPPPAEGIERPPVGPPEAGPERMVDEGGPPPEEPDDAPAPVPGPAGTGVTFFRPPTDPTAPR